MKRILAILVLAVCGSLALAQDEVNFKVIDMPLQDFSSIHEYKIMTIRSASEWQSYWNRYVTANVEDGNGGWQPMPRPQIDFKQFEVVAIHLGPQGDSGKIKVSSAKLFGGDYAVTIDKDSGGMVMHHTSNPSILIRLPRSRGKVTVVVNKGRQADDTERVRGGLRGSTGG
jgi:hypothetical protein